jgi:hypothetical protein
VAAPISSFLMPNAVKITGRSSSVTNSFVNSIIPVVTPTVDEVTHALGVLGMTPETVVCAYCGDPMTEWDHLRPLVVNKRPTGYISEIANLVPTCGKCNQSKGNKHWEDWIASTAIRSPHARGIGDLNARIERLRAYVAWREPTKVDFEALAGPELWEQHWANCDALHQLMRTSQDTADRIRSAVVGVVHPTSRPKGAVPNAAPRATPGDLIGDEPTDPVTSVIALRRRSNASWSNLIKATLALQGLPHGPFSTNNVENASKSCVRAMLRATGLDLSEVASIIGQLSAARTTRG